MVGKLKELNELKALENSGKTIILIANCAVRYSGRAESILAAGDRIVIIKQDNTILIHKPTGNSPVNYMKECSWQVDGNKPVLHAKSGKEFLDITLYKIYSLKSFVLEDNQKINLVGTERDMSDMIYANPEIVEPGLKPVSTEEQTQYGFIDVMCTDGKNNLVIIECKRYGADLSTVSQLRRYVEKVQESKGTTNVRGIVCAPKITSNAEAMLSNWGFKFCFVRPPNYLEEYDKSQMSLGNY